MPDIVPFTEADVEAVARAMWRRKNSRQPSKPEWAAVVSQAVAAVTALTARLRETNRKVLGKEPTVDMALSGKRAHQQAMQNDRATQATASTARHSAPAGRRSMSDLLTLYDPIDHRDDLLAVGRYDEADGINFCLALLLEPRERVREAA